METAKIFRYRFGLILLVFLVTASTYSQQWENLGLDGYISSVAFHPTNRQILYVVNDFEILKSIDDGISWDTLVPVNSKVGGGYVDRVLQIIIDPIYPDAVYATALGGVTNKRLGTIKTTDNGLNWSWRDSGIVQGGLPGDPGAPTGIFIDPNLSNHLYYSDWWKVYKTTDGGDYWEEIFNQSIIAFSVDVNNTDNVYVGAERQIYKSNNGGLNWQETKWALKKLHPFYLFQ